MSVVYESSAERPKSPLELGQLKRMTDGSIYNAVRFELLKQVFRSGLPPVYDTSDPVDGWRWLHVARGLGTALGNLGFEAAKLGAPAECQAPKGQDGLDSCSANATQQIWPVGFAKFRSARVALCSHHVVELQAMYPDIAVGRA